MMMMGEGSHQNPMVQVPPWPVFEDHAAGVAYGLPGSGELSPYGLGEAALAALQRYLPSNEYEEGSEGAGEGAVDAYSCDEFRMYEFKVRRCPRGRSHDWTECPYAHPGEKARRRDPRRYHYSGTACPDFRKGSCKRGDACEFAHGVFECWLHPARYRTQPCKDGTACRRRVCFFAHTPEQLRVLPNSTPQHSPKAQPDSYDGSPLRHHHPHHPASLEAFFPKTLFTSSPTSTLTSPPSSPPSESPPMSPSAPTGLRRASMPTGSAMNEVLASLRQMQLSKAKSAPTSWGFQLGCGGFVSPRGAGVRVGAFSSLPTTPMRGSAAVGGGPGWLDRWESTEEEEPVEMVESGSALRAKMFEKLSKEGGLDWPEARGGVAAPCAPDVGWISELK